MSPAASRMSSLLVLLVFCLPCPGSPSSLLRSSTTGPSNSELSANQTLVSEGNVFQFGFSTLPNSDGLLYLGIWYYNITPLTFVWIANRDRPFSDAAVTARLLPNGELEVHNSTSGLLWSSNSSTSAWGNYTAQLGRNGNLQIHSGAGATNNSLVWQSFDHPTETFLPDMTITLDRTTGTKTVFQSWKTSEDPTPGNFTLQLDTGTMNQLLILRKNSDGDGDYFNGSESKWWRSGPWNGRYFNGVNRMQPLGIYGFQFVPDPDNTLSYDKFQLGFKNSNASRQMRFVLLPNGTETTYVLESGVWNMIWSQPLTNCETYGYCGANTNCVDGGSNNDTKCECFRGFAPKSDVEWNSRNWSGGCVRRTELGCLQNSTGDDFWQLTTMKLPDSADKLIPTSNITECRGICSTNCSCKAYAFMPEQGCFTWSGDLVDAFQFTDGHRDGDALYIKLARSEFGERNKTNMVVAIVVPLVGCLILLFCLALCLKFKSKLNVLWKKGRPDASIVDTTATSGEQVDYSNRIDIPEDIPSDGKGFELPLYTFDCIEMATDNFNESNTLGKGGFGHVYRGKLPEGEEVAVKRLSKDSGQGLEEFKNEMILIAKLQHNNLVRLQGCCIQGDEKILIYEYLPNKSLDDFIFNPIKQPLLDWKKRFNIIEGVARGLLYLHRDSRLRIVHRDLKASNILLDNEMNPKISDFGMARIFGYNQNHENTNRVVGTFGYMSPEYAMEGLFSVKSDVYSFGVLILEIISGRKNSRFRSDDFPNLLGYSWKLWNEDRGTELIDPSIQDTCSIQEVLKCIHIALLCVQDRANERPNMSNVVIMLGSETRIVVVPKQPTFATVGSPSGTTTRYNDDISTNDMTVTRLTGR